MTRHVFNLQVKRSYFYNSSMMNTVLFLSFIIAWYMMLYQKAPNFVFMPFFAFVLYDIFLYKPMLRDWDVPGQNRILVDTSKKEVLLDQSTRIPFEAIERVKIEMDERPRMCWFLLLGQQYNSLVNGEVVFKLSGDVTKAVSVQFKSEVYDLLSLFKEEGIPCRIIDEERMNEKIPNGIWYVLGFLLIGGYAAISLVQFLNSL